MPKGAMISPPDSASSGSDDESSALEMRGRNLDKLKDLRDAVGQIPQARAQSPSGVEDEPRRANPPTLQLTPRGMHLSLSTSALGELEHGRRVSHVRSATEPNAPIIDNSVTNSEEDTDEDLKKKPQMVRKKSGELVRPALRPPSRRRPSSMPGTPVFSKAVHFDSHLEHVRHFLQLDRPLAVSAGSSPADNYDSDNEYPFPSNEKRPGYKGPPFEWELLTPNFPHDHPARKTLPVRLEKVWLSPDQKSMLGCVAVANLAFQKQIICRFTLDYWKTTSEVSAEYGHEIRPKDTPMSYDRFTFSIKLADTANLESKTLFLCVRYMVNGQEYWDNNSNANFQIDFKKKHLPQNGKNNFQGAGAKSRNGLPRSRKNTSSSPRPTSMPISLDDFSDDARFNFDQPIHEYLGESVPTSLRLKSKSSSSVASDNIAKSLSSPSGAAFSNRYDFGASLSAAVQAAKESAKEKDRDALYMKSNQRPPRSSAKPNTTSTSTTKSLPEASKEQQQQHLPGTSSPVPSLPSASYEELVNKYCFVSGLDSHPSLFSNNMDSRLTNVSQFGSKQSSPVLKDGTIRSGQFDGSTGQSAPASGSDGKDLPRQVPDVKPVTNPYFLMGSPEAFPTSAVAGTDYITTGNNTNQRSAEANYPTQPQQQHFLWRPDSQTPTVIRG